jgi:hypothetical protein
MKKNVISSVAMAIAGSLLMTGCVYSHHAAKRESASVAVLEPTGEMIVMERPPAPKHDLVVGSAPDEMHVWVEGYWTRANQRWVWVPGHWDARPRAGATWVPGHWDKNPTGAGWVWTPGYWE